MHEGGFDISRQCMRQRVAFTEGEGGLVLAAGFLAFEATRGWCALRACGVKTKF